MSVPKPEKEYLSRRGQRRSENRPLHFYRIRFRPGQQLHTASSRLHNLQKDEVVMVQTEHGKEPARVVKAMIKLPPDSGISLSSPYFIIRRSTRDEIVKYDNLDEMEKKAFRICQEQIERHKLPMNLVRVERFFNGGKIIFYFTAENRVDFRELVKSLVQEFRTRVEMRQIGVRHETKMLGGMGCCGRELCCSSFIRTFDSVSIKMAKEQNLPLNPAKISGACNRLLCCLNYEFANYKAVRRKMPKVGRRVSYHDQSCKVIHHNVLKETITVIDPEGKQHTLNKEEWQAVKPVPKSQEK